MYTCVELSFYIPFSIPAELDATTPSVIFLTFLMQLYYPVIIKKNNSIKQVSLKNVFYKLCLLVNAIFMKTIIYFFQLKKKP